MVKILKVVCIKNADGEKHYVVHKLRKNEDSADTMDFDGVKIRRVMKKQASRPLLLLREE